MTTTTPHPYFPPSLQLPHYVPPSRTTFELLSQFFVFVVVILAASFILIRRKTPSLPRQLLFIWFVACGFIHSVIEGYFIANYKTIAGQSSLLADCWKEYSYSDSRYMNADVFVLVMETITAVTWGPLSFLAAYWIYSSHPAQYILTFLISTGQLYGDILYYFTSLIEGSPHCSQSPFHFWFYFVGFNAPWIVIPLIVMWNSAKEITKCVRIAHDKNNTNKKKK